MLITGVVGGLLAGLLGVGGGIIIVPMLEAALSFLQVDSTIRMHVAVGTSLAIIIPTSLSSSRAHFKRGSVDMTLVKSWAPWIFLGALAGTYIASMLSSRVLTGIFAVIALVVATRMMLPLSNYSLRRSIPQGIAGFPIPTCIGFLSSMMGIGGGSFSVPVMTLYGAPIHRAVGTAALIGLIIAVPGTLGFMFAGLGNELLPLGSFGYVNLVGLALIAPTSVLAAPWGAKLAHATGKRQLTLLFGIFLLLVSVRMFMSSFFL